MTLEALIHGKGLPTASVGAGKGTQILVEGANMALQAKSCGEGPVTAFSGTFKDRPGLRVDVLMLPQKPGVPEHLAALLTPQKSPVLLLFVLL